MTEIDYTNADPAPAGVLSAPADHPVLDGTVTDPGELLPLQATNYHVQAASSPFFGDLVSTGSLPVGSTVEQPLSDPSMRVVHLGPGNPPGFHEWLDKWVTEVAPTVERKALEYGSGSLARKGHRFAAAQGRAVSEPEALDLGAELYALEKADRLEDALGRQRPASADTLVDGAVYLLMALYIRDTGNWA